MTSEYITCPKCLGARRFPAFSHIAYGACFTCAGNGTVPRRDPRHLPAAPIVRRDPIQDLRDLYRAACSQGRTWADEPSSSYDVADVIACHLVDAGPVAAKRVIVAYAAILTTRGAGRIRDAYAARLAARPARAA